MSLSAATASGLDTASQNDCEPSLVASHMSAASGSPTMAMRKVVTKPRDSAVPALSLEARALRGLLTATSVSRCSRRPERWNRAMMLFFGSKNRFCTFAQPPRPSWSIVKRPGRTGNFLRFAFSTLFTTGR